MRRRSAISSMESGSHLFAGLRPSRLVPAMLPSVRAPIEAALAKEMIVLIRDGGTPSSIREVEIVRAVQVDERVDVEGHLAAQVGAVGDGDRAFARQPGVVGLGRDGHNRGPGAA